jgi:hypothetical protein
LTVVWRAYPACLAHLVGALKRHVNALPAAYLLLLQSGEIFNNIPHCEGRLYGYVLAEGFNII